MMSQDNLKHEIVLQLWWLYGTNFILWFIYLLDQKLSTPDFKWARTIEIHIFLSRPGPFQHPR